MKKEQQFLNELADLLEKYNVEIESDYEFIGYNSIENYLDFDFQDYPYTSISFVDTYITADDIRKKGVE